MSEVYIGYLIGSIIGQTVFTFVVYSCVALLMDRMFKITSNKTHAIVYVATMICLLMYLGTLSLEAMIVLLMSVFIVFKIKERQIAKTNSIDNKNSVKEDN